MQTIATVSSQIGVCLALTKALSRAEHVEGIYGAALDALEKGLDVRRSAILFFDPDCVMRFKAWRGLSDTYRRALEGYSPWAAEAHGAEPVVVADVTAEASVAPFLATIQTEKVGAMAFVPLVGVRGVIGTFMLSYGEPHAPDASELTLAEVIAAQVAFAVERTRAEDTARRSEGRLRFALDAAEMGTWDWDLAAGHGQWSDNLERVHGLPPRTFDGTYASYEREIHPADRHRVRASLRQAIDRGVAHDVEYRVIASDGSVRWLEGKGHVEVVNGRAVRMTGVCMNVTRRKQAELERLEAAQETSRLKDEFLAMLSHELRTPLNAIVGWVQILQTGALPAERTAAALGIIARNARLQMQLIEDILDVSRIITGKLRVERAPVVLSAAVQQAVNAVRPAALVKRIELTATLPEQDPLVDGDARRLQQILSNLLSNAVKFTDEGGHVAVTCSTSGDHVYVEVRDSGIGISPEFLPYLFERFRQADSSATREHGGLGLGLAISLHLAHLHGGDLRAFSDGPGRGATFRLELPLSLTPAVATPHRQVHRADVGEDLSGARVLVVDDDADARQLTRMVMEHCGATVVEAASADIALAEAASGRFDVMLADIAMPRMDGYGLIERIRPLQPTMTAVAVSAYARPEDRAKALSAGYQLFERKPVEIARLVEIVAAIMKRDTPASR